jgi:hypothetical protein
MSGRMTDIAPSQLRGTQTGLLARVGFAYPPATDMQD